MKISDKFVPLLKIVKNISIKMKSLGETLRELRENKQLPLRTVAAFLDIDPAIMSRLERGQRNATREQVIKLAGYFNVNEDELIIAWLSDKVVYEISDEELGIEALRMAEEKVEYLKSQSK